MFHFNVLVVSWKGKTVNTQSPSPAERLPSLGRIEAGLTQPNWFQTFAWLEYSVKKDSAYCFACRVFGKNLKQDIFVSSGFKNWKKAVNAFHKHAQSHKDCIVSWNSYKASALRGNVVQQIEAESADEIRQRREYMQSIVAVTCMLGKQGLPFRGHDETAESHNKGNFMECMGLLQKFDPFLLNYTPPSNST